MALMHNTETARQWLMYAFVRVFKEIARRRPLLICLEDFHWADAASFQLLHYMAQDITDQPILVVVTYRREDLEMKSDGVQHPLTELLRRMSRENFYEKMDISRLNMRETSLMLERMLKRASLSAELCEIIYRQTEGNPFFIIETLKWLQEKEILTSSEGVWRLERPVEGMNVTDRVTEILLLRLDRLNEEEREILQAASVEGALFRPDLLARVLETNRIRLLRTLHRLETGHQLSSPVDGRYRFDHIKIRDILYNEMPPDLREAYHHMLAERIEEESAGQGDMAISDLAIHRCLGGDFKQALPYLIKAGGNAERLFALPEAERFYGWVMDVLDRLETSSDDELLDLSIRSGRVAYRRGDWQGALKHYHTVIEKKASGDPEKTAQAFLQMGRIERRQGLWQEALAHLEESLAIFMRNNDLYGAAMVYRNLGDIYLEQGEWPQAGVYYQQGLDIAHQLNQNNLIADFHTSLGVIASSQGDFAAAMDHYTRSAEVYEQNKNSYGLAKVYMNLGITCEEQQEWLKAEEYYDRSLSLSGKMGSASMLMLLYLNRAKLAVKLDDVEKAKDLCQRALDLVTDLNDQLGIAEAYKIYGMLHTSQGIWEQAEFYFEQSRMLFQEHDNPLGVGEVWRETGVMYAKMGDAVRSRQGLLEALAIFSQINVRSNIEEIDFLLKNMEAR